MYIPYGDNERADLIAEFNGKLNKIQVKTSVDIKNGTVVFDLNSSTTHRGGGRHTYTKDEVDYFACYNLSRDKVYLIPIEKASSSAMIIRFEQPKSKQTHKINWEADYLFENILCVETLHAIPKVK